MADTLHDLATFPLWVAWRNETRDGRVTKVPYDVRTGGLAESNNPATWANRGEAEDWAALHGAAGVGIMLGDGRIGIDLDSCRDPGTGDFTAWAQTVIARFQSYTEISPSGTGAKSFFQTRDADAATVERLFDGKHGRQFKNGATGDHPPSIEVYRSNRYFTVTGDIIGETEILRKVSIEDLRWLIREHAPNVFPPKHESGAGGHDNSRSAKALRKGAALKAGGASYEGMRAALLADEDPEIAAWARTKGMASSEREMHRVYDNAQGCGAEGVTIEDFRAYMPMHSYIFVPCREMWPSASVNARVLPIPLINRDGTPILDDNGKPKKQQASIWLDKNRPVECMTWAPGEPILIPNRLISGGGWIERNSVSTFNLYRPPQCQPGNPAHGPIMPIGYLAIMRDIL